MSDDSPIPPAPAAAVTAEAERPRRLLKEGWGWAFVALVFAGVIALSVPPFGPSCGGSRHLRMMTENRVAATTLANALEQYFTEFGRLLQPDGPIPEGADRDTDTAPSHGFVARLMGKNHERGVDFLDGFRPAQPAPETEWGWKKGLITGDGKGPFGVVDSAGHPFRIRLDTNGDHTLANPNPERSAHGKSILRKRVLVWSAGRDGDWSTWDDNVCSWE